MFVIISKDCLLVAALVLPKLGNTIILDFGTGKSIRTDNAHRRTR